MAVPPRPSTPPGFGPKPVPNKTRNVTKDGGFKPSLNLTFHSSQPTAPSAGTAPGEGGAAGQAGRQHQALPGSDFMSNEDIRSFCEYLRRDHRTRATERAMDADHLEAVLRAIPDAAGSLAGARARARRVSRWLKKMAAAEKAAQKYAASVYAAFEREYDSQLRQIGRGRTQQASRAPFTWTR